jgi:hypothetical protein
MADPFAAACSLALLLAGNGGIGWAADLPLAEPASASAPAPAFDLSGTWRGVTANATHDFSNRFKTVWSVRQTGTSLDGTVTFTQYGKGNFAVFGFRGSVDGKSVTFQAIEQRSSQQGWCFPAGAFFYAVEEGREYLAGRFLYNSVARGCSSRVPGRMKLERVRPKATGNQE